MARPASVMAGKTTHSTTLPAAPTRAMFSPIRLTARPVVWNFNLSAEQTYGHERAIHQQKALVGELEAAAAWLA